MCHQTLVGERFGFLAAPQEGDGKQGHNDYCKLSHSASFDVPAMVAGLGVNPTLIIGIKNYQYK